MWEKRSKKEDAEYAGTAKQRTPSRTEILRNVRKGINISKTTTRWRRSSSTKVTQEVE